MVRKISTCIDGFNLEFYTLNAKDGLSLLKDVMKIFGDNIFNINEGNIMVMSQNIISCVNNSDNIDAIILCILNKISFIGQVEDIDTMLSSRYLTIFKITLWYLKENFHRFLTTKRFSRTVESEESNHPVTRKVIAESQLDLILWRPILSKCATWTEVNTLWDINDLFDCLEALDIQQAYEKFEYDKASKK